MTNDARAEEVKDLLAENEALSQQLFAARAEFADLAKLKAKMAELEAEIILLRVL